MNTSAVESALEAARSRLDRLAPREAWTEQRAGALLVDIRPASNRDYEGGIPGAVIIDRNVLEWRLDPSSDARIPVASPDLRVVIFCNEGYASSFAAATLRDLGVSRATDLIGGYRAWRSLGLPTDRSHQRLGGILASP